MELHLSTKGVKEALRQKPSKTRNTSHASNAMKQATTLMNAQMRQKLMTISSSWPMEMIMRMMKTMRMMMTKTIVTSQIYYVSNHLLLCLHIGSCLIIHCWCIHKQRSPHQHQGHRKTNEDAMQFWHHNNNSYGGIFLATERCGFTLKVFENLVTFKAQGNIQSQFWQWEWKQICCPL